jgi:hypothetical protein
MTIVAEKELKKLRIVWTSQGDGSLRMTWADGTLSASLADVKERRYGR